MMRVQKITIVYFVSLYLLGRLTAVPLHFYFLATLCYLIIPALGSVCIRLNFYLKATAKLKNPGKNIVLTLNLSPQAPNPEGLLALFDKYGFKAIIFCTGDYIQQNTALVSQIAGRGHLIGNMGITYSKSFGFMGTARLMKSITSTSAIMGKITQSNTLLFRPPRNITNPFVARAIRLLGYRVLAWNTRLSGSHARQPRKFDKLVKQIKPGDVLYFCPSVMSHTGLLERLFVSIREKGLKSTTDIDQYGD